MTSLELALGSKEGAREYLRTVHTDWDDKNIVEIAKEMYDERMGSPAAFYHTEHLSYYEDNPQHLVFRAKAAWENKKSREETIAEGMSRRGRLFGDNA